MVACNPRIASGTPPTAVGTFLLFLGVLLGFIGFAQPSAGQLAGKEFERRRQRFRSELSAVLETRDEPRAKHLLSLPETLGLEPSEVASELKILRLMLFRLAFQRACEAQDRSAMAALIAEPQVLGLDEQDVSREMEFLRAVLELYRVMDALPDGTLPIETPVAPFLDGQTCHFVAGAFLEKRGPDETGRLLVTAERFVFEGGRLTSVPWNHVFTATRIGSVLSIQRSDRQTPYEFHFDSLADALRADYVIHKIRRPDEPFAVSFAV